MTPLSSKNRLVRAWLSVCGLAAFVTTFAWAQDADLPEKVTFNRHIRPILSNNCFQCHGPDQNTLKAGLRFDIREQAISARGDSAAIVPGDSAASLLVQRINAHDTGDLMPPPKSEKALTDRDRALLTKWIDQGAEYEAHWAYITPERPTVPTGAWPEHPVDAFVRNTLAERSVSPAPQADKTTLIRRLSFDLIGLPPTPDEVTAFVNDTGDDAYERLVQRLLDSPHYGERMAIDWLDQVRYADTNGFHGDEFRSVFPYRDYVIDAFNTNMPFDQFSIEQLAGDLLPDATQAQQIASGYNRLNQLTAEGGAQAGEYLAMYAADRVRTTSSAWMGATMGCAECHDHKFDPLSTRDFYSFAAFFADITEEGVFRSGGNWAPNLALPSEQQQAEMDALNALQAAVQQVVDTPTEALAIEQQTWEADVAVRTHGIAASNWQHLGPFKAKSFESAYTNDFGPEATIDLAATYQDDTLSWQEHPEWVDGEVHDIPGDLAATYLYRTLIATADGTLGVNLGSNDAIKVWFNGEVVLDQLVQRPAEPDQDAITINYKAGENQLLMKIVNAGGGYQFYYKTQDNPEPSHIIAILAKAERTEEESDEVAKYFRGIASSLQRERDRIAAIEADIKTLTEAIPTSMITVAQEPREMRILPRGNWMDESGDVVEPNTPEVLPAIGVKDRRATRLDLAKWLVSSDNPLTARVMMNRLWAQYFGTGLSKVLDDLGSQGEAPSHPDLLDWLAVEFVESGWDLKHMVQLIVTSETYRQASDRSTHLANVDPHNRLLARQARLRLEAELVRDNALAISGLLSPAVGGRSVFPYQPDGYYADCNTFRGKLEYNTDVGSNQYRRGLYTIWKRSFLHPSMLAFDAPNREECTAERVVSNTPLQALVLLNDPTYVEAARVFAQRIYTEGGGDFASRLQWAYANALSREPSPEEKYVIEGLYNDHLSDYIPASDNTVDAPESIPADEFAAWTSVARTLLNLHETITRS
jgi:hypothetical protein